MTTTIKRPELCSFTGIIGAASAAVGITSEAAEPVPPPPHKIFDDVRDNALIAKGSHFFCRGHLRAVPIETQSRKPEYCQQCLAVIEGERRPDGDSDSWAGEVFTHHGKRYSIHADIPKTTKSYQVEIKTYCLGGGKSPVPEAKTPTIVTEAVKGRHMINTASTAAVTLKSCAFCGQTITWGNSKTKYCSDPCKKSVYLQKKTKADSK